MSLDVYLDRRFSLTEYNCRHLARDVILDNTGVDIEKSSPEDFVEIDTPEDFCIVLLKSNKSIPHVGVFVRGKIVHIREKYGVMLDYLKDVSRNFIEVKYYQCK